MNETATTILLVDDDEGHLLVARRALARASLPVEVRTAASGAEALRVLGLAAGDAAEPGPRRLVLVMLDLSMPGLSGWELLRRIRESERTGHVPIVVVSSSKRPEDVLRSYQMGANSYLVKRFEALKPGSYLVEAARYWIELNEPPVARSAH